MRTLNFYILRQVIAGLFVVTVAMLAIVWLTQSLRLIDMIMTKGLSVWLFLKLTFLLMPSFLVILMPIAVFAICLFVYNRMTIDKELVIANGAGLSPIQFAYPVIALGLVLTFLAYFMTFFWVPKSVVDFKELQWSIRNDFSHIILQEGEFNEIGPALTVYVRERDDKNAMYGLLIHDERGQTKTTVIAERGAMVQTKNGARAVIENGSRQEMDKKTGRFSVLYFDRYVMDFGLVGEVARGRAKDIRELSMSELLADRDNPRYLVELNKRISLPLYNICFVLLAVSFLVRGMHRRKGQTEKVVFSSVLMLLVQSASLGIENIAVKNTYLIPLMYLNVFVPIAFCFYVLLAKNPLERSLKLLERLMLKTKKLIRRKD